MTTDAPLSPSGFLAALYEHAPGDHYLEIRPLPRGRRLFLRFDDLRENGWRGAIPAGLPEQTNVYFGALPRIHAGAGGRNDVQESWALWADFDKPMPDPWPAHIPVPTIVIRTSPGKYHAWWLLDAPIRDMQHLESLERRLAFAAGADMAATDRARILRMPGTLNHKYPERPLAAVVFHNPVRYTPELIDMALPVDPTPTTHADRQYEGPFNPHDIIGEPPSPETLERIESILLGEGAEKHYDGRLVLQCPDPTHDRAEAHHNFYWSPKSGRWWCFGQLHIGRQPGKLTVSGDWQQIARWLDIPVTVPRKGFITPNVLKSRIEDKETGFQDVFDAELKEQARVLFPVPEGMRPDCYTAVYANKADPRHLAQHTLLSTTWATEANVIYRLRQEWRWYTRLFARLGVPIYSARFRLEPESEKPLRDRLAAMRKRIARAGDGHWFYTTAKEADGFYVVIFTDTPDDELGLADDPQALLLDALRKTRKPSYVYRWNQPIRGHKDWRPPRSRTDEWVSVGYRDGGSDEEYVDEPDRTLAINGGISTYLASETELMMRAPEFIIATRHYRVPPEQPVAYGLQFLKARGFRLTKTGVAMLEGQSVSV